SAAATGGAPRGGTRRPHRRTARSRRGRVACCGNKPVRAAVPFAVAPYLALAATGTRKPVRRAGARAARGLHRPRAARVVLCRAVPARTRPARGPRLRLPALVLPTHRLSVSRRA